MLTTLICATLLASPNPEFQISAPTGAVARPQGRLARPFTVAADLAWNGLGGTGVLLAYDLLPHVSLDAAGGLSGQGYKAGARARYNFLASNFTPFVGLGASYALGLGSAVKFSTDGNEVAYEVDPTLSAQAVVGLAWVTDGGFSLLSSVGYARALEPSGDTNLHVVSGAMTPDQAKAARWVSGGGGGPVVSLALGYAM